MPNTKKTKVTKAAPPKKQEEKKKPSALEPKVIDTTVDQVQLPLNEDGADERSVEEIIADRDAQDRASGVKEKYYEAVGRRKESTARVRLMTKKSTDQADKDGGLIIVNGKSYVEYFKSPLLRARLEAPLIKLKSLQRFKVSVKTLGGGISGQANAIRHGIARALEKFDPNFRKKLRKSGFLTRDPRAKERRKYGLKKARKAPRWSKR